ncbi:MAG: hypothetical protein AAF483_29750, partial [Planctomycetota bacterium]
LRIYRERPAHFANSAATIYGVLGFTALVIGLCTGITTVTSALMFATTALLWGMGGTCLVAGLLAELMIRQNQRSLSPVLTEVRHDLERETVLAQKNRGKNRRAIRTPVNS